MMASRPSNVVRPRGERGFALLIVFLMAAAVALMMYRQIPRVAFESQRDKEELLIDRGKQYSRAITLYYHEFNKFPTKIEDLENTNNKRFLRRRYIDPMTGKSDWRLIHANAAGALIDSLVVKPPGTGANGQPAGSNSGTATGSNSFGTNTSATSSSATNGFGTNNTSTNATGITAVGGNGTTYPSNPNDPNAPPQVNAAVLRRPSDRTMVPSNGPLTGTNTAVLDPNDPRYWPPITLATPTGQAQPAQPGQNPQAFNPQFPGQQSLGQQYPGQANTGQGNYGGLNPTGQVNAGQTFQGNVGSQQLPGQVISQQVTGQLTGQQMPGLYDPSQLLNQPAQQPVVSSGPPIYPGQPGFDPRSGGYGPDGTWVPNQPITGQQGVGQAALGQPGQAPGGVQNAALPMINSMLRNPAPTPPPITPTDSTAAMNAAALVGVASTFEAPSIKTYKTRHKYNEWEFLFEFKKNAPAGQQPNNPLGPQGSGTPNQGASIPGVPTSGTSNPGTNLGASSASPSSPTQ